MPISSATEPRSGPGAASPAPQPPADLAIAGLRVARGGVDVLSGVDLAVGAGERVALIGPNGAGKSTLLMAAIGLVPASAGEVHLFGRALPGRPRRALRSLRTGVGFVFQRHNLVTRASVLTNVIHGALGRHGGPRAWAQGLAPAALRAEAMACLDRVGLADLADRRADRLSGGQRQRVAIARALMQRPRLMLADEPAASLDPQAGGEVMALLAGLAREQGIGLLFTSHDMAETRAHAERVVALRAGRVAFDRPVGALDQALLETLYG